MYVLACTAHTLFLVLKEGFLLANTTMASTMALDEGMVSAAKMKR